MGQKSKEPRAPVSKDRAAEHALMNVRRVWAGEVPDFEAWGGVELDPEPIIIHDLNGQVLFYEFGVMDGGKLVGSTKANASKLMGAGITTIELGPRLWDPDKVYQGAQDEVKKRFPKAKITGKELVCYCYPKIGARFYLEDPELGNKSLIFDVGDLSLVDRYGAEELEGFTAYSLYEEVAEPHAPERERRWELEDRELEAARTATPRVFERAFTAREQEDVRPTLIPKTPFMVPFYRSKTIKFSTRCQPHGCFELYGQKNNFYCAVATGQMILDFYRYYYSQDDIATAMGTTGGGTSNPGQVQGYEQLSRFCLDATYDSTAKWSEARAEINQNRPLKSGVPGHARACAGWSSSFLSIWPNPPRRWLKIYDPSPPNPDICAGGRVYWENWDAINHTNFIYVRHRATPCR